MTSKKAIKLAYTEFQKDFDEEEGTNKWLEKVIEGLKQAEKDLDRLEKQDKAIEIIIRKKVNVYSDIILEKDYASYKRTLRRWLMACENIPESVILEITCSQEEFKLLKEVFG